MEGFSMKKTNFNRILVILCSVFFSSLLYACNLEKNNNSTEVDLQKYDFEVDLGESKQFSKEEIDSAISLIEKKIKDFGGCQVIKIWYDEGKSDSLFDEYEHTETLSEAKKENVIFCFSNFKVDPSGVNPVLNAGETYEDFKWIITREDKTKEWNIVDFGY